MAVCRAVSVILAVIREAAETGGVVPTFLFIQQTLPVRLVREATEMTDPRLQRAM